MPPPDHGDDDVPNNLDVEKFVKEGDDIEMQEANGVVEEEAEQNE